MRKILVFQHVAHEILGTLNPLLKAKGFRVRYVNFDRDPQARPSVDKYDGLIILGGYMGVYESKKYPHIEVEMRLIEKALKKNIPILGICLGAQLVAHALGANVRKHTHKEMGWHDVHMTTHGQSDLLLGHFGDKQKIFQMHGDTFDIPQQAQHLAFSDLCAGQAFRYGDRVYGLQFHLEVDRPMIDRWLSIPANLKELTESQGASSTETILADTVKYLENSILLSQQTFVKFLTAFGERDRHELLGSDHAKPVGRRKL